MLATKRSAGYTTGESQKSIAHKGQSPQLRRSVPVLQPRANITRSPKQGYQLPQTKDQSPSKLF